jgi:hypothetical protein
MPDLRAFCQANNAECCGFAGGKQDVRRGQLQNASRKKNLLLTSAGHFYTESH